LPSWNESDHPRGRAGRFGSGGGGSEGSSVKGLKDHPLEKMREYTPKELDWEYGTEYLKYSKSFAPNAFKSREDFQQKYDAAPLRHLSDDEYHSLENTMGATGFIRSKASPAEKEEQVREIVGEHRRDVGAVLKAIDEGETAPPIVLKKGNRLRLMAGNTRIMSAAARGLNMPVKVIDVGGKQAADVALDGWYCISPKGEPVGPFTSSAMADRVSGLLAGKRPSGLAYDRSMVKFGTKDGERTIAFDRQSTRFETIDGHMKIKRAPISKATVNPYKGSEIPGYEELGLDPEKVYMLLRDPAELAKAAPTFEGLPLLITHIPVSADDHPHDEVVGSTGTGVTFEDPYLMSPLSVWTREAIEGIEDNSQRELSSGYHYVPVMKAGVYKGARYDGVMTQIVGNHVALVEKGRAGHDVVVGDSARKSTARKGYTMAKKPTALASRTAVRLQGALSAYFMDKLASDAALDLTPILSRISRKRLLAADGKTLKKAAIKKIAELALDAAEPMMTPEAKEAMPEAPGGGVGPDDVILKLIEHVIESKMGGGEAAAPAAAAPELENDALEPNAAAPPAAGGEEEDPLAKKKKAIMDACLQKGMSEDDASEIAGMMAGSEGAEDEFTDNSDKGNTDDKGKKAGDKHPSMDKKAMDAAIDARVKRESAAFAAQLTATAEAREAVAPLVGKVSMALDSAQAVYQTSLKTLGMDVSNVQDLTALKMLWGQQVKIADAKKGKLAQDSESDIAMDGEGASSFFERFPYAATIRTNT